MEDAERLAYYVPDFVHQRMQKLNDCIANIETSGDFYTSGRLETFPNPGLQVGGINVPLPPSKKVIEKLLGQSKQSPFGLGSETIVDTTVRDGQEIDGAQIVFNNPKWSSWFHEVVLEASRGLGVPHPEHVEAKLYKMLLYAKGGNFKVHQDTEREPGMFATLVLCLPCKHVGGEVVLSRTSFEADDLVNNASIVYWRPPPVALGTSASSAYEASYLAWYSDVHHTVLKVTSGHRLVLTYNLINTQAAPELSAKALGAQAQDLRNIIKSNICNGCAVPFMLIPLQHQYTARNLRLDRMKGRDYHIVSRLSGTFDGDWPNYEPILGHLLYEVLGQFEDHNPDLKLQLLNLCDLEGKPLNLSVQVDLLETHTLNTQYTDRKPWEHIGGGYMGNQSAEVDDIYKDTVVIMAPSGHVKEVVNGDASSRKELAIVLRQWLVQAIDIAFHAGDNNDTVSPDYGGRDIADICNEPNHEVKQEHDNADVSEALTGGRTVSTASLKIPLWQLREDRIAHSLQPFSGRAQHTTGPSAELLQMHGIPPPPPAVHDILALPCNALAESNLQQHGDEWMEEAMQHNLLPTHGPSPPTEPYQRQEKAPDSDGEV